MISKKLITKSFVFFLFLFMFPSLSLNVNATLVLEEPELLDVEVTWSDLGFIYDNQYHNSTEIWEEISMFEQQAPDLIDVEVIGNSYYGKEIKSVRITNELRIHQKAKTLVVSHHHGREQISVEVALRFILHLLAGYGVDNDLTEFINTQEIYIIPTLNPDALDLVVDHHEIMLRKNARPYDDDGDGLFDEDPVDDLNGDGTISWIITYEKSGTDLILLDYYYEGEDNDLDGLVNEDMLGHIDLNRNYDMFFRDGVAWNDDSQAGNYPGTTAFSEPETQAFQSFALQHLFAMAYSLHSGTNATYFAKNSHTYMEPDITYDMIADFSAMRPVEYHFNDAFNEPPEVEPYYAAGIWELWMYFERETLMPMTLELYGNKSVIPIPYQAEVPIFENSTHLITEWKGIDSFYNPDEIYINSHWDDVQPFFPYLLENTPVLNVEATLNSEVDRPGSLVNMTFVCTNLSPKLHAISPVNLYNDQGISIFDGEEIQADSTVVINTLFNLPPNYDTHYEIKIGNDYTGYHHYIIKTRSDETVSFGFSFIGVALIFIGIGFHRYKNRK